MPTAPPAVLSELDRLRGELLRHPLYERVTTLEGLRTFTRSHVFAVWDFMSLLKRLQRELTDVSLPWTPPRDPELARFVNEIVLAEESDDDGLGGHASHFEMYLAAMREIGADVAPIERFLESVIDGTGPAAVLEFLDVPDSTKQFVIGNLELAEQGAAHEVAAAFCHGREDVIPDMFERLIETLERSGQPCPRLRHYLERHVELDGDEHGPLARRLVETLADSPAARDQVDRAAVGALRARIRLWDGILAELG